MYINSLSKANLTISNNFITMGAVRGGEENKNRENNRKSQLMPYFKSLL